MPRKEIGALQAENYSLERQLFSYQKSLAYAQSSSSAGQGAGGPSGGSSQGQAGVRGVVTSRTEDGEEVTSYEIPHPPTSHTHSRAFLDRSVSTDTEYA